MSLESLKERLLANPKVKDEYDKLAKEFQKVRNDIKHRALVRIVEIKGSSINVVVPAYDVNEVICLPISFFPTEIKSELEVGMRFFSLVNLGAKSKEDLVFEGFQLAAKPNNSLAKYLSDYVEENDDD